MVQPIAYSGTVWAADRPVLGALRDLALIETGTGLAVQAVAGPAPGLQLSAWALDGLTLVDNAALPGPGRAGTEPEIVQADLSATVGLGLVLGDGLSGLTGLWADGAGGWEGTVMPGGGIGPDLTALAVTGQGAAVFAYGLVAGAQAPASWSIGADGRFAPLSQGMTAPVQANGLPAPGLTALAAGEGHVVAGGTGAALLSLYSISGDGRLALTDTVPETDNPGLGGALSVAIAPGHVIAAAAGSGTLTVWAITPGGGLALRDHVIDSLHSRFQGASHLAVASVDGAVFVAAGGADSGISLFRLTPGGRLVHLAQLADAPGWSLDGLAALDMAADGQGRLHLVSAGLRDAGISHFTYDPGPGLVVEGVAADESLTGGAGADILRDGAGTDTVFGGAGADIFAFDTDGLADTIADFEAGIDRLDLSGWAFWRGGHQLRIDTRLDGAEIVYEGPAGTERLVLLSADGGTLSAAQVQAAILTGPDRFLPAWLEAPALRPPDPPAPGALRLDGTPGDDVLQGAAAGDTITGLGGSDRLGGGAGADLIIAGIGFDTVLGGDGDDTITGLDGYDSLSGGSGEDAITGNNGNDWLAGEAGHDRLEGGFGADTVLGGDGNDTVLGGSGPDLLLGEDGADLLQGNAGADTLQGGAGDDRLEGGINHDRLEGGAGQDSLLGGNGADSLRAGADADRAWGNAGNDALWGDGGGDSLWGGIGHDRLEGGTGNDWLWGEDGADTLLGGAGDDRIEGNAGDDWLEGGGGSDWLDGGIGADTFVFREGTVQIARFQAGIDTVLFDAALWGGGARSPEQILAGAVVTGTAVVLDFGGAGLLRIEGLTAPDLILDDIGLV